MLQPTRDELSSMKDLDRSLLKCFKAWIVCRLFVQAIASYAFKY